MIQSTFFKEDIQQQQKINLGNFYDLFLNVDFLTVLKYLQFFHISFLSLFLRCKKREIPV